MCHTSDSTDLPVLQNFPHAIQVIFLFFFNKWMEYSIFSSNLVMFSCTVSYHLSNNGKIFSFFFSWAVIPRAALYLSVLCTFSQISSGRKANQTYTKMVTCRRAKSTLSLPCSLIIIFSFSSVEYMEKTAWTESRITSQTPFMQFGFHGSLSRVWRKHFWTKSKLTDLKCQCTFHCWIWIVKLCRHF